MGKSVFEGTVPRRCYMFMNLKTVFSFMRKVSFVGFIVVLSSCGDSGVSADSMRKMTDSRDGQTYEIVTIGNQVWMAENLNYEMDSSYCYNDSANYCDKYGRLYVWSAAMKACPNGWHLPSWIEFNTLRENVGNGAGRELKSKSGWDGYDPDRLGGGAGYLVDGNGSDDYGFSALPAGTRSNDGGYFHNGYVTYFWSSTEDIEYDMILVCAMSLNSSSTGAGTGCTVKDAGFSVRCVKD